jgi:hypothetical protein
MLIYRVKQWLKHGKVKLFPTILVLNKNNHAIKVVALKRINNINSHKKKHSLFYNLESIQYFVWEPE